MGLPKGIVSLSGRDYPTWPFVLNKAHEMGLLSIETTLVQIPTKENGQTAIVQAVATFTPATEGGPVRRFAGLGDAGPHNVNAKIAGATLRMAETRAMGRALRTGTNIGETMYEELGADEERDTGRDRTREALAAAERPLPVTTPGEDGKATGCEVCGMVLSKGQVDVSTRNYRRKLCPAHQRDALAAQQEAKKEAAAA